eukprot:gene66416-90914_t
MIAVTASALYFTHTVVGTAGIILLIVGISSNRKQDTNYAELISKGALIVDVRSAQEYAQGHIKGSTNIPLEKIEYTATDFRNKTVITCCRSGYRSKMAKIILAKKGIEAYDGGAWNQLEKQLILFNTSLALVHSRATHWSNGAN